LAGTLRQASAGVDQIVEIDTIERKGGIWAWTGGVGWDISRNLSVGATVSYLSGDQRETNTIAHGIPDPTSGDEFGLCYQCGSPSDSTFRSTVSTDLSLHGWTGSAGFLWDTGFLMLGSTLFLPRWMEYRGGVRDSFQDPFGAFPDLEFGIVDKITLPVSLAGGGGLQFGALAVTAEAQWTDWSQIDFEGDVRAPDRQLAYRPTVDLRAGVELEAGPFAVRAGYSISPLPYRLIAADTAWEFTPGSEGPGSDDDLSGVLRDYPDAEIENDREILSAGAGLLLDKTLRIDAAYTRTTWDRRSVEGYVPIYGFITRESENEERLALTVAVFF
jgi:long-subunit fatty acid transport protein